MKLEISRQIFEKQSNFVKIRAVGAELSHADGRTDMKKLIIVIRNFVNAPENAIGTSQQMRYVCITKLNLLMICRQIFSVYSGN